jgi:hypothetical protein
VIHDVDEALRALIKRDALHGATDVDVSFEAPTTEWSARRSGPTINVYLYDVREDTHRRQTAYEPRRGDDGIVTSRKPPPRRFKLSYLLTAWTQRPEDEHRLLSACLGCFLRHDAVPSDVLTGTLANLPASLVTVALPVQENRAISEIWTALGGELKPSLDIQVNAPFDTEREREVGPPVLEEPALDVATVGGVRERPPRQRQGASPVATTLADRLVGEGDLVHGSGAVQNDRDEDVPDRPGRWFRARGTQ